MRRTPRWRRATLAYGTSLVVHLSAFGAIFAFTYGAMWEYALQPGGAVNSTGSGDGYAQLSSDIVFEMFDASSFQFESASQSEDSSPPQPEASSADTQLDDSMPEIERQDAQPATVAPQPAIEPPAIVENELAPALPEPNPVAAESTLRPREPSLAPVSPDRQASTGGVPRRSTGMQLPMGTGAEAISRGPVAGQGGLNQVAGADVDLPPRNLPRNPAPEYPLEARLAGWEGQVILRVTINVQGRVDAVKVHKSSGHEILDDSATRAVQKWRFAAARRMLRPVAGDVLVPIRFVLNR